ncbi:UDP-N-acetylglucosamine--N-acetylmuramyl-(pentapeptide) pyrophosphoryl-undecaprenol N-acetylglucosamine transferase [Marisediminicola senii]|uniref:UDP-N-acetylglucosamine--N-acetylmuramyl- (pentapeptide) pyrophosphoryl-undecaprenol N-acetylglucosamine transferase n=1 Tax=Marisediminicola senii TaxID=2711233 RepID=UPI0013EA1AA5|nr:UDP-N-acetylglucosamine--N-acetylmuramyl-(pentapeptide) pyrophosphoryl-undecaprenol N-acetylglucosamine transferase [Marisediminicola senii]
MTRYLLAGGGTAGHVNPLLAVADRLTERDPDAAVFVLGTAEGLESRLVPERGYPLLVVRKLPFPRRPSLSALRFPGRFAATVARIRALIVEHRIDVLVGFGGYVSAPAYLAARREKIPIVLHEANARPGIANRFGSLIADSVGVAFRGTRLRRARFVGMPLRSEIEQLDRRGEAPAARTEFGLDARKPTLVVTGGSLGAEHINAVMAEAVHLILGAGWQVLHITGERTSVSFPTLPGYHVLPYCNRMDLALAVADLVLARAGSSTVSELSALAIPAVYVPLGIGNGEQKLNARDAVAARAAHIVDNADFTPDWIADKLLPILGDRARLAGMAASASSTGVRNGTDRMVALIDDTLATAP